MGSTFRTANRTLFVTLLLVAGMGIANAAFTSAPSSLGVNASFPLNSGITSQSKSGSLKVGGTTLPVAKASLEIGEASGATGGLLLPRVTTAQRNSLAADGVANAGLTGLQVYNTQLNQAETFNGTNWIAASATSTASLGTTGDGPAFFLYLYTDATGSVGWNDVGAMNGGNFTPQTSLQVGEFATPTGVIDSNTGVFTAPVSGKYIFEFSGYSAQGAAICKNGAAPSGTSGPVPAGCVVAWGSTYGGKVNAVFDLATGDTVKTWTYLNSGNQLTGGSYHYTHFAGARVGTPVSITYADNSVHVAMPAGAVQPFNRTTCPTGWILMDGNNGTINMQGMYMVGSTPGTMGNVQGNRLSNLQNITVGTHSHSIPSLAANALTSSGLGYTNVTHTPWTIYSVNQELSHVLGIDGAQSYFYDNYFYDQMPAVTVSESYYPVTTQASNTDYAGSVSGTNAPYVQWLICKKL